MFVTMWVFMASFLVPIQLSFAQNVLKQVSTSEPLPATITSTQATTGAAGTSTTGTKGTRTPATSLTTQPLNLLPTPTDIPVVPGATQNTQEQHTPAATTTTDTSTLVCTQDKCAASLNQAMGNEIIVMTILLFGAIIGGILWILALLSMKKSVMDRETRRMERQTRLNLQKMIAKQKVQAYGKYINSVIQLIDNLQHKTAIPTAEMREFQEGSVFIALHGSKKLCVINDHIASLIRAGKPVPAEDQTHLKLELGKTIRADLM